MDKIPIEVGLVYELVPEGSDQWIQIYAVDRKNVYASGVDNTEGSVAVTKKQFDDNVVAGSVFGRFLKLEDGNYLGYNDPGFIEFVGEE